MPAVEFLFNLAGKKPYQYQIDIDADPYPKKIINKSRQMGLSYFCAVSAIKRAFLGKTALVVSPSDRQSSHLMGYIYDIVHALQEIKAECEIESSNQTCIAFKNGGAVYSLPNSAHTVRGFKADFVIMDEAALFLHNTDKQIWQAILPTISRGGEIWLISTPFGQRGLFFEIWQEAERYNFKKYLLNYKQCPDIKAEEIKKSMDSISWAQEYENEFIGDLFNFLPLELILSCVNPELEYTTDFNITKEPLYFGCDIGRTIDFTAVVGLFHDSKKKKLTAFYKNVLKTVKDKEFSNQRALLRSILMSKRVNKMYLDCNGIGMQLSEELLYEFNEPVQPTTITNELKQQMFPELKRMFEAKEIEIPADQELIGALRMIERKSTAGGNVTYGSDIRTDEHGHFDIAMALALAIWAHRESTSEKVAFTAEQFYRDWKNAKDGYVVDHRTLLP